MSIVVDTFSNAVLPGVDISYVHYPLLSGIAVGAPYLRNRFFFLPYKYYLRSIRDNMGCKLLANSEFTAAAIKSETGIDVKCFIPQLHERLILKKLPSRG